MTRWPQDHKSTNACGPSPHGNSNHPPIKLVKCIFCHDVFTKEHWHVILIIGTGTGGTGGTGVQVLHHGSQTFWKKMNDVWYFSSQRFYSISLIFPQEQEDLSNGLAE